MGRALPWIVALGVVAADRLLKVAVMAALPLGARTDLVPGVALWHVHNRGIAFSLFADGGPRVQLALQAVIVVSVAVIAYLVARHGDGPRLASLGLGAILGGAVGNLWDRVLYGWVVDFVHLYVRAGGRELSWPDFNLADAAITLGAAAVIVAELAAARGGGDREAG